MKSKTDYRPDIDGLRALAVLSVILHHVSSKFLPGGFLGVDIFFVISGYLISSIIFKERIAGNFSLANFYGRRIRRIFPALTVVLIFTILFGYFALFNLEFKKLARHISYAVTFFLNFRLIGEAGYFDVVSHMKPLLHLWSLSVEEQFYLLWPLMLIFLGGDKRARISALIVFCFFFSYLFIIYLEQKNINALFYHPLGRFWELLIGASLAHFQVAKYGKSPPNFLVSQRVRNVLSCLGGFLIIVSMFVFSGEKSQPSPFTILPLIGVVMIITAQSGYLNKLLSVRPIVFVGLISYPLYLWHWPILSYLRIMESGAPPLWLLLAAIIVSFLLAWLTYVFVEKPFRHELSAKLSVSCLCVAMLLIFIGARAIVWADGLPNRSFLGYASEAIKQTIREPARDDICPKLFPNGEAPTYCKSKNLMASNTKIAIIGDSHAHVLFPGLAELAKAKGYGTVLLANSGCPPLLGAVTGSDKIRIKKCSRNIRTILNFVRNDENIKVVIIVSRGPIYIEGKGFGTAEEGQGRRILSEEKGNMIEAKVVFESGLIKSIDSLQARGKKVAYFLQPPELGVEVMDCVGRPLSILGKKQPCGAGYHIYRDRMREYREIIARVKSLRPSLIVIDVERLFCGTKQCYGMIDNKLLYADDDHLSVLGSRLVAPAIMKAIGL